jgi:predicted Zn-dependent protease
MVVFKGLLDFVENDDELSIILAHEMSHVSEFFEIKKDETKIYDKIFLN